MVRRILKTFRVYLKWLIFVIQQFFLIPNVRIYIFWSFSSSCSTSIDRMPPQIGDFVSAAVYDGQLQSNPLHPITNNIIACHLIDVSHGKQESQDSSYKVCDYFENLFILILMLVVQNLAEVEIVLQIAEQLQIQDKSFRIITPYDAQRSALENGMKEYGLEWEDKCFNVDSFQGQILPFLLFIQINSLIFCQGMRMTTSLYLQ